ncbi:MAG: Holliday junction resolvase RuvX [Ignavibacteria bacterium]|nr:Holliday junction resolvase RuvX [Ignavibacteria bacterium]
MNSPVAGKEFRYMGIDYGSKRIGIALCDPLLTFAYSYKTLINDNNFLKELTVIIEEMNVTTIVLGLPSESYHASRILAQEVRKLKNEIETKLLLKVILWDEEFTSILAEQQVFDSVKSKKKRKDKGLIDRNSAAIILQEYLNNKQNR